MNVAEHNRQAWNDESDDDCDWSIPVEPAVIEAARNGEFEICLTTRSSVPREWFPENLTGLKILCLASGGGQQAPVLAATGAKVVDLDISDSQLAKDRLVAERDGLDFRTEQGEMNDLSRFADESFDLIFHPASNCFIPDVNPVWRECHRVLRPNGTLLSGFMNPAFYLFDHYDAEERGILEVKYPLPYSDLTTLSDEDREIVVKKRGTVEFGHTLNDLIGGQLRSGFVITDLYEDYWEDSATLLNVYSPTSIATRAKRM